MNYNTVENSVEGAVRALYNGNISETFWRTSSDDIVRKYGYRYDNLNRLTEAIYQKPILGTPVVQNVTDAYNEAIGYDKNGNIEYLMRNGYQDNDYGISYPIDNLVYEYQDNQLVNVQDTTNSIDGFRDGEHPEPGRPDYDYDGFGNMKEDWNRGISKITYNHLNLPTVIEFGSEPKGISYIYNALGVKVVKTVMDRTSGSSLYLTDYQQGFQYLSGALQFFPTAEGYVSVTDNSKFNYVYNYTDHLGNVRLSYSRPKVGYPVEILEQNHYYPFGMKHMNYGTQKSDFKRDDEGGIFAVLAPVERNKYQYKYNGKEYQDELSLNWYDYGARNYDPAIGRWMNIDPLAEQYRRWSPYNYVMNSPNRFVDPDGMRVSYGSFIDNAGHKSVSEQQDETAAERMERTVVNASKSGGAIADHIIVNKNEDGTYRVVGGEANNDTGIYINDGEGGKGQKIGNMKTTHSFFNEKEELVSGAVINMSSTEGQNFVNGVIGDNPSLLNYMFNATNGEKYDFKVDNIDNRPSGMTALQYKYRGSVDVNGNIGSARDFGNYVAGLVAARSGLSWMNARAGFDTYQGYKSNGFTVLPAPGGKFGGIPTISVVPVRETTGTVKAQQAGYNTGIRMFKK